MIHSTITGERLLLLVLLGVENYELFDSHFGLRLLLFCSTVTSHINAQYIPEQFEMPPRPSYDNEVYSVSEAHWQDSWSDSMIRTAAAKSVMATWTPSNMVKNLMIARGSEGVYIIDSEGKRYLDWTR